jgi:hypothetical protein
MTQRTDIQTADERHYETPTFDPRSAFARTLRGGEMARLGRLSRQPDPSALESSKPRVTQRANGEERRFETPMFDPRSAFARTLRGGEMARQERRRRTEERLGVLPYAA